MKCQEAEREILSQLGLAEASAEVAAHLRECTSCALLAEQARHADLFFDQTSVLEPSPFLWTRIQARLEERRGVVPHWLFWPTPAWLAAGFLFFFSVLVGTLQTPSPSDFSQTMAVEGNIQTAQTANPFLAAQYKSIDGDNPFLEAMMPRQGNPFLPKQGQ